MIKTVTKKLPVDLTDAELLERGDKLAQAEARTELLYVDLAEVKSYASEEKKRIDEALERQRGLRRDIAEEIATRKTQRNVECEVIFTADLKVVTVRKDTGEVVDVRDMTADEQQMVLGEEPVELSEAIRKAVAQFEAQMAKEATESDAGDDVDEGPPEEEIVDEKPDEGDDEALEEE